MEKQIICTQRRTALSSGRESIIGDLTLLEEGRDEEEEEGEGAVCGAVGRVAGGSEGGRNPAIMSKIDPCILDEIDEQSRLYK